MFSEIAEIKSIREQKLHLLAREKELSKPVLTNLDMIPTLYMWFSEIISNRDCPGRVESVTQRKKFLFIVLFLYSPATLAEGKMLSGLREELVRLLNVSPSVISNNCRDIVFLYNWDPDWRMLDGVFIEILSKIKPGINKEVN